MILKFLKRKEVIIIIALFILFLSFAGFSLYLYMNKEECICNDLSITDEKVNEENNEKLINLEVKGEVKNPGVYSLKENSIIKDAIELCGGFTSNANTNNINLSMKVKDEMVTEQGTNADEMPKQVQKKVLHIKINTKTLEQMKNDYHFPPAQNKQLAELTDNKYASLWNGVIYGATDSGEYVNWRQAGQSWSNIKIGNTNSTIGNIGCLVTSIAILIEKSGVPTPNIEPFNPGTFVEALNKNGGFDERGNLYYGPISKVVPNFKYVGNVNLRGKSRSEKLALITQYVNAGYFVTEEVKGATPGNQHWVAVTGVNGNNVIMVDPASNQTDMWSAYEWSKSSQFNYFKAN